MPTLLGASHRCRLDRPRPHVRAPLESRHVRRHRRREARPARRAARATSAAVRSRRGMPRPTASATSSTPWPNSSASGRCRASSPPPPSRAPASSSMRPSPAASASCCPSRARTDCWTGRSPSPEPTSPKALFGLPEPDGELLGPIAVNDVDLLVIPAAAVGRDGMRLGWGRGYFDKTLGSMEGCPPVYAVIFDSETPRRGAVATCTTSR